MTNTLLLNEKISKSGFKKKFIATRLKITPYGLQKKINGESEFKSNEITALCGLLNITSSEQKVQIFLC